jgi:ketosteroid isomerase-like protein
VRALFTPITLGKPVVRSLTTNCFPRHYVDVTTPFDDPQAELAWMFLQSMCEGGDLDEGFGLLSDDFTYWSIVTRVLFDKEKLRRAVERRQQLFEVNIDLLRCVNEGETVVIEGEVDGIAADNTRYDSPFVCIFETRDGLIVSLREYSDTQSLAKVFPEVSIAVRR